MNAITKNLQAFVAQLGEEKAAMAAEIEQLKKEIEALRQEMQPDGNLTKLEQRALVYFGLDYAESDEEGAGWFCYTQTPDGLNDYPGSSCECLSDVVEWYVQTPDGARDAVQEVAQLEQELVTLREQSILWHHAPEVPKLMPDENSIIVWGCISYKTRERCTFIGYHRYGGGEGGMWENGANVRAWHYLPTEAPPKLEGGDDG
jgi:hypothetical protein